MATSAWTGLDAESGAGGIIGALRTWTVAMISALFDPLQIRHKQSARRKLSGAVAMDDEQRPGLECCSRRMR
jgi:hypothetical protein